MISPNCPICAISLMYSFLMLSILVTPTNEKNRNIFNSATSIFASCLFVSATVSNPYNIAGLTATLYTFPFTLAGTHLSDHSWHSSLVSFIEIISHDNQSWFATTLNWTIRLLIKRSDFYMRVLASWQATICLVGPWFKVKVCYMEHGGSVVECRARNRVSPGLNTIKTKDTDEVHIIIFTSKHNLVVMYISVFIGVLSKPIFNSSYLDETPK